MACDALNRRRFFHHQPPRSTGDQASYGTHHHHELSEEASDATGTDADFSETFVDAFASSVLGIDLISAAAPDAASEADAEARFRGVHGNTARRKLRKSRPSTVLGSIHSSARGLYMNPPTGKVDLSYRQPRPYYNNGLPKDAARLSSLRQGPLYEEPLSLYSILARYLEHHTKSHGEESNFTWKLAELDLLRRQHFTKMSVEGWARCITEPKSTLAAEIFHSGKETPPLFVLLLFLRRRHMSVFALGVILRHVDTRFSTEPPTWDALKILTIRLLRHARQLWPEPIPWIASLFADRASVLFGEDRMATASPRMLADVARVSNTILLLLSLPARTRPILNAVHQEKAQFQVLRFMAGWSPALTVTSVGFRAITRNQLAHPKTSSEREWAELKGPSWPPWKENRTAMDEDKGYDFGASRASRILHRMYEAGYRGHLWEEMAQIYGGWDTDSSPTIQTRTSLPDTSSHGGKEDYLNNLVWAARVRTTRTRQEAWACFLAYEASNALPSQQVYLAMFEKIHYPELKRSSKPKSQDDLDEEMKLEATSEEPKDGVLPGDMKESLANSTSPLHQLYLNEPVPSKEELYNRLRTKNIRPANRLLAFLLDAAPSFASTIELLEAARSLYNGGIGNLLHGHHDPGTSVAEVPAYLLAAFIKSLCRFGRFARVPQPRSPFLPPERHACRLGHDRHYLLVYADALLHHYRPHYRPAWTAYMSKLVRSNLDIEKLYSEDKAPVKGRGITQFVKVWKLVAIMEEIELDVDDEIFNLVCVSTTFAAEAASAMDASSAAARHVFKTASPRLRKLFFNLVGATMDMHSTIHDANTSNLIPPHIPGPAELHAYVRALGMLHDFEGLYSFSSWVTKHHKEVTARSEAQHSGARLLFRMLVALRAALEGRLQGGQGSRQRAPDDIVELIRGQIEGVEEWGGWPESDKVDLYAKGALKSQGMPGVGGR
ncbi:hypothetical protein EK21DRAFT_92068 [Setomelanomma holmii]|uniref:Uncharacterized protein n=1 Tax=Setomelanomma holmii TaxID=210430 RepID=A0A9P4LJ32_9PLEO|nr:hypothetical protein EK21DRAFT_92068 [Setomelanomma holmii]